MSIVDGRVDGSVMGEMKGEMKGGMEMEKFLYLKGLALSDRRDGQKTDNLSLILNKVALLFNNAALLELNFMN